MTSSAVQEGLLFETWLKRLGLKITILKWYSLKGFDSFDHEIFDISTFCSKSQSSSSNFSRSRHQNPTNYTISKLYFSRTIFSACFENVTLSRQPMTSSYNMADFGPFGAILGDLNDQILLMNLYFYHLTNSHDHRDTTIKIPF